MCGIPAYGRRVDNRKLVVDEDRVGIDRSLGFYKTRRPHSPLDGRTPEQAYFNQPIPEATTV